MKIGFKRFQELPNRLELEKQILDEARKNQSEGWSTHATIGRVVKAIGIGSRIVESVIRSDSELMANFKQKRKVKIKQMQQFMIGVDRGYN